MKIVYKILLGIILVIGIIVLWQAAIGKGDLLIFSSPTTAPTPTATPRKVYSHTKIPILYYHCVSDDVFGIRELFVSPKNFDEQMKYLNEQGYTAISFHELEEVQYIEKPILITFDDGYENNYTEAYPILQKYGLNATIFLSVNLLDQVRYLKKSELSLMKDIISYQSHTMTHTELTKISLKDVEKELSESKRVLEELTGEKMVAFAYPVGKYNRNIIEITKKYYQYAVNIKTDFYHLSDSTYEMKRLYVPREMSFSQFVKMLNP